MDKQFTRCDEPKPHYVFAGGVTGGHLFPGLAVAELLIADVPCARVTFIGPGTEFDLAHVRQAGFDYMVVPCPRLPRHLVGGAQFAWRMWSGYRKSFGFLRDHAASVVVGLGGFASLPAGIAAGCLGVPLVLLEQNAVVGRANRFLTRWADHLCLSFDGASTWCGLGDIAESCALSVTGVPVRSVFQNSREKASPNLPFENSSRPILLVLGGSGGARLLNHGVPRALAGLRDELSGWRVVHQTGAADVSATAEAYRSAGISATVAPFFADIATYMSEARLAICRAGGSTLAELAMMGVPAVLVPLVGAADDHQRQNALPFSAAGAAAMIDTAEPADLALRLTVIVKQLLGDSPRRLAMKEAMGRLTHPAATAQIAGIIRQAAGAETSPVDQRPPSLPLPPVSIDSRAA